MVRVVSNKYISTIILTMVLLPWSVLDRPRDLKDLLQLKFFHSVPG